MFEVPTGQAAVYASFFLQQLLLLGDPWHERALMPAGSPSSMPLQQRPGPAPGCPLSHPWTVYIQRDTHEGLASLPGAKQLQLAPLNAQEQQL